MKVKNVSAIILFAALLLIPAATSIEQEFEIKMNMTIDYNNVSKTRSVMMYYPNGAFPGTQFIGEICTWQEPKSAELTFKLTHNFECNMTEVQNDFTSNITTLINLTQQTNGLIKSKLADCDQIREANMELSLKLREYDNLTEQANKADQYKTQLDSCQTAASSCQETSQKCTKDLKSLQDRQAWNYIIGGIIGAIAMYFFKVRKDYPRNPVEEQFGPGG
jgi:hypothetical protein